MVSATTLVLPLIAINSAQAAPTPKSDLSVTKLVRAVGQTTYSSSIFAAPGDTVEYQITVLNKSTATAPAAAVKITDVLPPELTFVSGSLVDNGNACSIDKNVLKCSPGSFPAGVSATVTFKARLDDQISTANLPPSQGHLIDVQKQEVFVELTAGQSKTISAPCPAGYLATDGGLLIDSVDQGSYSDVVVTASQRQGIGTDADPERWQVKATNLGDDRVTGKVMVDCLKSTLGGEHTHQLVQRELPGQPVITADSPEGTSTFSRSCDAGEIPFAPVYDTTSGTVTVRKSAPVIGASVPTWEWVVDHGDATNAWFGISCLSSSTTESFGHRAVLTSTTTTDTVAVVADSKAEKIMTCKGGSALVGGYAGVGTGVLSLGKMPRGGSYMFRFYNEDLDNSTASTSLTCLDARTSAEAAYKHVANTALVTTTTSDLSSSDNTSTADVAVQGDPAAPPAAGVAIASTGTRTLAGTRTKSVNLAATCNLASTCSFTVKVIKPGTTTVLATKAFSVGSGHTKTVAVPTTAQGRTLGLGVVNVRVKTTTGSSTSPVNITS